MENNSENHNNKKHFPDTVGSLKIFGLLLLCMLLFLPVLLLFDNLAKGGIGLEVHYLLAMGVPAYYLHRKRKKHTPGATYKLEWKPPRVVILLVLASLGLLGGIISPIIDLIPMPDWLIEIDLDMSDHPIIYLFIGAVVLAPILEEIIFRGIVLDGLLKNYSPLKAILISSILFAAIHLNPWQFVTTFIAGLFIGWVYYRTRNLAYAIIIHAANNFFAVAPTFFIDDTALLAGEVTTVEMSGGRLPYILITIAFITLFAACLFLLKKLIGGKMINRP